MDAFSRIGPPDLHIPPQNQLPTKPTDPPAPAATTAQTTEPKAQLPTTNNEKEVLRETIAACEGVARFKAKQYTPEFFLTQFSVSEKTNVQQAIIGMYYSFTSLTTVGFGDYNPRSELERIFCAMILLFGVAIFSYIMGNFKEVLIRFQ